MCTLCTGWNCDYLFGYHTFSKTSLLAMLWQFKSPASNITVEWTKFGFQHIDTYVLVSCTIEVWNSVEHFHVNCTWSEMANEKIVAETKEKLSTSLNIIKIITQLHNIYSVSYVFLSLMGRTKMGWSMKLVESRERNFDAFQSDKIVWKKCETCWQSVAHIRHAKHVRVQCTELDLIKLINFLPFSSIMSFRSHFFALRFCFSCHFVWWLFRIRFCSFPRIWLPKISWQTNSTTISLLVCALPCQKTERDCLICLRSQILMFTIEINRTKHR